jgi:hypothetical protein
MSDPLTPEAKSAVMQLMGQTYGQMKKQDGMIVGSSAQLQGKSDEMKRLVEQLVATPTVANQQQPQPQGPPPQQAPPQQAPQAAPVPTGPPAGTITPEQAMAELQQAAPAPVAPTPVVEETMEFDFSEPSAIDKLVELQKETNLLLKDIKLQLESTNVKPTRKKAKSKVA